MAPVDAERPAATTCGKMARMTRFVALLGGINVGGHRVTMDRLRTEVASLGYTDVATFIASGNVMFTAPARGATTRTASPRTSARRSAGRRRRICARRPR